MCLCVFLRPSGVTFFVEQQLTVLRRTYRLAGAKTIRILCSEITSQSSSTSKNSSQSLYRNRELFDPQKRFYKTHTNNTVYDVPPTHEETFKIQSKMI